MRNLLIILLVLICSAASLFAQRFDRYSTVTYHGNEFQLVHAKNDTVSIIDSATGNELIKVRTYGARVQKMNGLRVYETKELSSIPAPLRSNGSLELYLLKGLISDFNKLSDGIYGLFIHNMTVDIKGKIVYYQDVTFSKMGENMTVPKEIERSINSRIDTLINKAPIMKPGIYQGKPVISSAPINTGNYKITVRNHKTTFTDNP